MCTALGSDLNACLTGGCNLATSRGEIIKSLPCANYELTLIKPKNLGISAKEAYTKYAARKNKPKYNRTENKTQLTSINHWTSKYQTNIMLPK